MDDALKTRSIKKI